MTCRPKPAAAAHGSSNPRYCDGNNCIFLDEMQKSAYPTEYLGKYQTDLHQLFSIGKLMYWDYKINISFALV